MKSYSSYTKFQGLDSSRQFITALAITTSLLSAQALALDSGQNIKLTQDIVACYGSFEWNDFNDEMQDKNLAAAQKMIDNGDCLEVKKQTVVTVVEEAGSGKVLFVLPSGRTAVTFAELLK